MNWRSSLRQVKREWTWSLRRRRHLKHQLQQRARRNRAVEITELLSHGIVTEKTVKLQEKHNQYTFKVALKANKIDVRRAVETIFKVKIVAANIMLMPGKQRRISLRD